MCYFNLLTNTYRKWLQQWCKDTHNYINSKGFDNESLYPGTPTKAKEQFLSQFVLRRIKNPGQVWPRDFCRTPMQDSNHICTAPCAPTSPFLLPQSPFLSIAVVLLKCLNFKLFVYCLLILKIILIYFSYSFLLWNHFSSIYQTVFSYSCAINIYNTCFLRTGPVVYFLEESVNWTVMHGTPFYVNGFRLIRIST